MKGIDIGDIFDPGNPLFYVGLLFFPLFLPIWLVWLVIEGGF